MASRPLPPGRRGRGARAAPALHLPDVKILSDAADAPPGATLTSSYAEQLRAQPSVSAAAVEPEHESTTKDVEYEPTPVRSVKAFVSSLEKAQDPVVPDRVAAAAAGEDAPLPRAQAAPVAAAAAPPQVVVEKPTPPVVEKPTSPVVVSVATAPTKQVALPPIQQAHVSPPPVQAAAAAPPVAFEAPIARSPSAPAVDASALEGIHPFKALLPIYAVPEIPETVDCVFDDAALEMQKNIMKVVKKVFGKDRTKLEDFKINSRLFGNNFMDPLEYVESLVKDLGGNRALVLVPCLVCIQPDFMKRSSMLVAARNYRLRCLAKLEASLDKVEVAAPPTVPAPVELATPKTEDVPAAATIAAAAVTAAVVTREVVQEDAPVTLDADVAVQEASSAVEVVQEHAPDVDVESRVAVEHCYAEEPADAFVPPVDELVPEGVAEAVPQPTLVTSEPIAYAVSEPMVYAVSEPQAVEAVLMEPTAIETPLAASLASVEAPALVSAAVEPTHEAPTYIVTPAAPVEVVSVEPSPISHPEPIVVPAPPTPVKNTTPVTITRPTEGLQSADNFITVDTTVSSDSSPVSSAPVTPSAASPVHHQPIRRKSTISLFGEEIADDDDEDESDNEEEEAVKTVLTASSEVAPTASAPTCTPSPEPTPASSFYEAESLFGEVLPVVVKPAAESPAPTPAPTASILKPPPARTGMLFGFASAGGDSDSDSDSEFSD